MAVFTSISTEQIQNLLLNYDLGSFINLEGIASGIENTNYFLTTSKDTYVFTIFERLDFSQLPFYLELMHHLAQKNICVPLPIKTKQGEILNTINSKPMAIVTKLAGKSELQPNKNHIISIAQQLAKMHLAGQDFKLKQKNLRSIQWWNKVSPDIVPFLQQEQKELLITELETQNNFFNSQIFTILPQGVCHCDLFRDNALFMQEKLSGIFDFYFAGIDTFLFDICIVINDWCIEYTTSSIIEDLAQEFLQAYSQIRLLTKEEKAAFPLMLRAAALRFWISRLWDYYLPRKSSLLNPHNPEHFEKLLANYINNPIYII